MFLSILNKREKIKMSDFGSSAFAKFLKKNKICPVCNIKKLIAATKITQDGADGFSNSTALTPPMGWASRNLFGSHINENIIYETAQAMRQCGLGDFGYTYVNIDDCWMSPVRDENGRLCADPVNFPSGMKELVKKINDCGFKAGIYTSNGTLTCQDMPSSLGHERTDAESFADWGFEFFKYDFCHNKAIPTSAPEIAKLTVSDLSGKTVCELSAEEAILRGTAERFSDNNFSAGNYIGGLDAKGGEAIFDRVSVPEAGEYIITLLLHRSGIENTYAEITVNGVESYALTAPGSLGIKEGRAQVKAKLRQGINSLLICNPISSRMDSAAKQYRNMGYELIRAAELSAKKENREIKPICYSICEWGLNRPWKWGHTAGNMWRTTPDIRPKWNSILGIYEHNVRLDKFAGVGHWNDPDMLEVGNGDLTYDENRAHFTLWCMMASPLILGNDIRKFIKEDGTVDTSNPIFGIITEKEAIAINQDKLGIQCKRVKAGICDILVKPLENNEIAVCLFNKGSKGKEISFDINELTKLNGVRLPRCRKYTVRNIWDKTDFISSGIITEHLNGRDVLLYRIKAEKEY